MCWGPVALSSFGCQRQREFKHIHISFLLSPIFKPSSGIINCIYLLVYGHVEDGEGEHGDDAVGDHVDVDEIYLDIPLRQSQICGENKHIVLRIFIIPGTI